MHSYAFSKIIMNLLTESSIMSVAAKELGTSEAETRLGLSLADLVSTLEGTKLTQQQRLVAAATTAIARKCDDLFDTTPLEQMDPRQALVDAIEGK